MVPFLSNNIVDFLDFAGFPWDRDRVVKTAHSF